MKKYKVIYNPSSGNELMQQKIFQISKSILVKEDVAFTFYATKKEGDAKEAALNEILEYKDSHTLMLLIYFILVRQFTKMCYQSLSLYISSCAHHE